MVRGLRRHGRDTGRSRRVGARPTWWAELGRVRRGRGYTGLGELFRGGALRVGGTEVTPTVGRCEHGTPPRTTEMRLRSGAGRDWITAQQCTNQIKINDFKQDVENALGDAWVDWTRVTLRKCELFDDYTERRFKAYCEYGGK
ncbi:hypothetical protein chiPu_0001048 [Chiloscyllium punctatum]|uniref:Uncharacterized protein n=1 Tax=Chiloscyllium punctatum TaxID=137246 RepID=A0A401RWX6_CHIPU|nr:hypothetical protein [Chiloscyllium punctatum]